MDNKSSSYVSHFELIATYPRIHCNSNTNFTPEPFGLVGPEAMAYARPVVGFRRGGISDWLSDGETGFLVEPGNVPELAQRIDQLLANPALAEQMGRMGRAYLERKFDPAVHCATIVATYERAIQKFNLLATS